MSAVAWAVGLVAAQRLAELALSRRNARRLLDAGAVEVGRGHYPAIVAIHVAWLAAMLVLIPADEPIRWPIAIFYILVQPLRLWAIASLGPRWTTRIVVMPGAALVTRGPYRWLRHPNYLLVAAEIALLPLAFGAWTLAFVFSVFNAIALAWRILTEQAALAEAAASHANVYGVVNGFERESAP